MGSGGGLNFLAPVTNGVGGAFKNPFNTTISGGGLLTGGTGGFLGANIAREFAIEQPRAIAQETAKRQMAAQAQVQAQIEENDLKDDLTKQRDASRARQLAAGAGLGGRAGTILTSPLGVVDNAASVGGKTLLGL